MTRLVGNQGLDNESLHTFALEVERIINSRPITILSDDPDDGDCLAPNMLINTKLDVCGLRPLWSKPFRINSMWYAMFEFALKLVAIREMCANSVFWKQLTDKLQNFYRL